VVALTHTTVLRAKIDNLREKLRNIEEECKFKSKDEVDEISSRLDDVLVRLTAIQHENLE